MTPPQPRPRAFTLVELLVVIGIIALLIGVLIPVVSKVRLQAQTTNSTQQLSRISQAISSYQLAFQGYPGVLPNAAFANPTNYFDTAGSDITSGNRGKYTQAEDLAAALLGGLSPAPTPAPPAPPLLRYSASYAGTGPATMNRNNPRKQAAFMQKTEADISTPGKVLKDDERLSALTYVADSEAPEFIDQYSDPRPILYMRLNNPSKSSDPAFLVTNGIVVPPVTPPNDLFHYNLGLITPYLNAADSGEILAKGATNQTVKNYFATGSTTGATVTAKFAGTYILISAGPDRKFGTDDDIVYGGGGGGK